MSALEGGWVRQHRLILRPLRRYRDNTEGRAVVDMEGETEGEQSDAVLPQPDTFTALPSCQGCGVRSVGSCISVLLC
jgi:hypothetical protein